MVRRTRRFLLRALLLLLGGALAQTLYAQTPGTGEVSKSQSSDAAATPSPAISDSRAKLGVGDLIEVSVFGVPDLNTKARIGNNGDVYLPLIDYVHLSDLTVDEAQEVIEKRLSDGGFVRNPHVSILVNESASQAATLIGEVSRPGNYPVIGDRRLFDLFSLAGGLTDKAGRSVTIIHRQTPDQKVELKIPSNLAEDTQSNVLVQPGDTIIVSRAGIIYVVGAVNRPSGFMIEDDALTVLKALALAGGGSRTASLNGSKILRQTPTGIQEISVPLKKVLQAKVADVPMIKGDVLFVPGSAAKALAYRGAEAAMSMTTAVSVVAARP